MLCPEMDSLILYLARPDATALRTEHENIRPHIRLIFFCDGYIGNPNGYEDFFWDNHLYNTTELKKLKSQTSTEYEFGWNPFFDLRLFLHSVKKERDSEEMIAKSCATQYIDHAYALLNILYISLCENYKNIEVILPDEKSQSVCPSLFPREQLYADIQKGLSDLTLY